MSFARYAVLGGGGRGGGVDPSSIPFAELARVRGAMWSTRLDVPYGPRPNQPDNILAMDYYEWYDAPTRARMLDTYLGRGYTHAVTGSIVDAGYHGQYPAAPNDPTQAVWDHWLDALDEWWARKLKPIVFLKPDGWKFDRLQAVFESFLLQPRSQRLIRIVVGQGWEPDYDVSSFTHAMTNQWLARVLPNAIRLLHLPADRDAPVGTDEHGDDNGQDNALGWNRVSPLLHGFLIQNGPYTVAPSADATLAMNFGAQFKPDGAGADTHSIAWHFRPGGPWNRTSAWGDGIPIRLYNGECTAYNSYWQNLPETTARAWGDLAIASGASGYLDGGTVEVPK